MLGAFLSSFRFQRIHCRWMKLVGVSFFQTFLIPFSLNRKTCCEMDTVLREKSCRHLSGNGLVFDVFRVCVCVCVCFILRSPQVKSILEDLDDADYYGSDHEERENAKGRARAGKEETVEEELARLVSELSCSQKKSGCVARLIRQKSISSVSEREQRAPPRRRSGRRRLIAAHDFPLEKKKNKQRDIKTEIALYHRPPSLRPPLPHIGLKVEEKIRLHTTAPLPFSSVEYVRMYGLARPRPSTTGG